jgi:hypothetical protein
MKAGVPRPCGRRSFRWRPCWLVAAARGTSRHDGRALRIVAAAAARSAACERELRPGPDQRSMTPLTQLSLLRFFREGRVGGPQIDAD